MEQTECYDPGKHKVILISGMQWGDEGKGKLVSHLSGNFDIVARYNGGHNSGHEVFVGGTSYKLHLLPCGALNGSSLLVLGNGTVVHLPSLVSELDQMRAAGFELEGRLLISDRAHLVLDFHVQTDVNSEANRGKYAQELGTTKKGIGPTYASKCFRTGLQVGEMFNWSNFERLVYRLGYNMCSHLPPNELEAVVKRQLELCKPLFERVKHCVGDASFAIRKCIRQGGSVFFEGANGVLLDLSLGTYPFVTSSNTTTSGVYNGLGVSPSVGILKIGVLKAYQTRVGEGPFITELMLTLMVFIKEGEALRCAYYSLFKENIDLFMKLMTKYKNIDESKYPENYFVSGSNNYGFTYKLTVIDINGIKSSRIATLRPQSAYTPLFTPFAFVGLGKTNNYVEELYLGVSSCHKSNHHMWISIIPSCTVITLPIPLQTPSQWILKLSIIPAKKLFTILLSTAIALFVFGLVILIFDLKEKREDFIQAKGFRQKFIIN